MRSLVLLLGLLTVAPGAMACSCLWVGPFPEKMHETEIVIRAKVVSYGRKLWGRDEMYSSMVVDVLEVLKGRVGAERMRIKRGKFTQCEENITRADYPLNSEVLILLHEVKGKKAELPVCGPVSMRLEGDRAIGYSLEWDEEEGHNNTVEFVASLDKIRADLKAAEMEEIAEPESTSPE